ncbi:unknown [Clostridium sp. CAG:7]|nr:unknown [Clostridium sp. CAG:7]
MSAHKPLEGVKVVELASFVAGPTAGKKKRRQQEE